ncbi:MAG: leucine-rich repeat protein [Clostridia bacterium]|nr:leucine-rich repeat protein [Clostridia bacterium]
MKRLTFILLLLTLSLALVSCFASDSDGDSQNSSQIKVILAFDEGVTVNSENPVYINPGETASFAVSVSNTCIIESLSHGSYKDGVVSIDGLTRDTRVELSTLDLGYDVTKTYKYTFEATDADATDIESGSIVNAGTLVKVSANEKYKIFLGWSVGSATEDKSKMISEEREFSFRLSPDMVNGSGEIKLFANYAETDVYYYDANGGSVNMTGLASATDYYNTSLSGDRLRVEISAKYLEVIESVCLFFDDGTFKRDGYVLREFNTKSDGSGVAYSLGSKYYIDPSIDDIPVLFCIWEKASDTSYFTYENLSYPSPVSNKSYISHWKEEGVIITSYTGNEEKVVIPEKLSGKHVIGIASDAFINKDLKTLVLSKHIQRIETGAFVGCDKIETIYYPDSIYDISNDSFDDASYTSLRHLYVNATMAPRYTNGNGGAFAVKLSRLLASNDKNRIIVIAGSSTYQGMSSEYMEALLDGEYRVINFGTTRTTNGMIYLEAMKYLAHENDIIIYAPENSTYMAGENELYWKTLNDLEGMYNIYRYIDISNYTNVFGAFAEYNQEYRYTKKPRAYEAIYDVIAIKKGINKYGEYQNAARKSLVDSYYDSYFITMNNRYKSKHDFNWDDVANQTANKDYTDPNNVTWESIDSERLLSSMNKAILSAKSSGARVYFGFAPADADKIVPEAREESWLLAYDALISEIYEFDGLLGSCTDYIYAHEYFYDCAFHLNDVGRAWRSYQMYVDICEIIGLTPEAYNSVGDDFEGCIFENSTDGKPLQKVDYLN